MNVFLKIDNMGTKVGNNFTIVPNVGVAVPSTSIKADLYNGIFVVVDNTATFLTLTSDGVCSNCPQIIWISGLPITTSTTTTLPPL